MLTRGHNNNCIAIFYKEYCYAVVVEFIGEENLHLMG